MNEPASALAGVSRRAQRDDDRDFLRRLYASTRAEELRSVDWTPQQTTVFLTMQFEAQSADYARNYPECELSIVEREGEPIGRLYVDRRADEIRVVDIALLPEHRGHGIGRALMEEVLAEGARRGLPVRIHVERYNAALRLYQRLGFERLGDNGVYFLMEWRPKAVRSSRVST